MKKRKRPTSMTYAQREYGVTSRQLKAFVKATEKRYYQMKMARKLVTIGPQELKKFVESERAREQFLRIVKGAKTQE
jgi:hypothetical protein